MATYGVNLKIDVSKIMKEKMFKGQKGTYLDATVFLNADEKDQYDNNGMITQNWKEQQKGEGPILGNATVFWRDDNQQRRQQPAPVAQKTVQPEVVQPKVAPAKPKNMARPRPTANEMAAVIAEYYGETQSVALTWILEAKEKAAA